MHSDLGNSAFCRYLTADWKFSHQFRRSKRTWLIEFYKEKKKNGSNDYRRAEVMTLISCSFAVNLPSLSLETVSFSVKKVSSGSMPRAWTVSLVNSTLNASTCKQIFCCLFDSSQVKTKFFFLSFSTFFAAKFPFFFKFLIYLFSWF